MEGRQELAVVEFNKAKEQLKISRDSKPHVQDYVGYMYEYRESEFYRTIRATIANKETVTDHELALFLLFTDDIENLDIKYKKQFTLSFQHGTILSGYYRAQITVDPARCEEHMEAFIKRLEGKNQPRQYFVNLSGINLENHNLSDMTLSYINLSGAKLANVTAQNTYFNFCCLDQANCTGLKLINRSDYYPGVYFVKSSARYATFDHCDLCSATWIESDFTGSSFQSGRVGYGSYESCIFDDTNFENATFYQNGFNQKKFSMRNANLINADIRGVTFYMHDFTGAKFLPTAAFIDSTILLAAISHLIELFITTPKLPAHHHEAIYCLIAQNIAANCKNPDLLTAASNHPAFQVKDSLRSSLNTGISVLSLFSPTLSNQLQYKTPPQIILATATEECRLMRSL